MKTPRPKEECHCHVKIEAEIRCKYKPRNATDCPDAREGKEQSFFRAVRGRVAPLTP